MKKKILWLSLSFLLVAALVLASCAPAVPGEQEEEEEEEEEPAVGPQYGGTVHIAFTYADVPSFDRIDRQAEAETIWPFTHDAAITGDWYIDREICDFQYTYDVLDRREVWTGGWAESWEQTDPSTLTFKVRKGIHWQDKPPLNGREFVAEDVKLHFDRLLAAPAWSGHPVTAVDSVTVPDKYTVIFKSAEPNAALLNYVAVVTIAAHELWEEYGDLRHWTTCIGTGPFMLEDYVPASHLTYIRNPDYWMTDPRNGNQLPYVAGVELLIIPELSTRVAALVTGKLDLLQKINWEYEDSLAMATAPGLQLVPIAEGIAYQIWWKNNIEPFNNLKVRHALSMAIDRRAIADAVFPPGTSKIRNWPIPEAWQEMYTPFEELSEAAQTVMTYDPEGARALLAETPWPTGFTTSMQYAAAAIGFAWAEDALLLVQDYWSAINVDLELKPVDIGTRASLRTHPFPYEAMLGDAVGGSIKGCVAYYLTGGPACRGIVSDPYIDEMNAAITTEFDAEKATAMLKEVYAYILGQAYGITLPQGITYTAWWPWLKEYNAEIGIMKGPGGIMAHIWLDQDLREEVTGER